MFSRTMKKDFRQLTSLINDVYGDMKRQAKIRLRLVRRVLPWHKFSTLAWFSYKKARNQLIIN